LGLHGAGIVSGMAAGVDAAVTNGALCANAPAVGVLGCGLDVIFPKSNEALYRQMEVKGCLLSEFPPGTPAAKWNFPRRNRIISGLSVAVVVVEAPERSGALITARHALDQGRDVFVVPGRMGDPGCAGSNRLLRDGAGMVTCPWDILESQMYRYPILRQTIAVPTVFPDSESAAPMPTPKPVALPKQVPQPKNLSAEEQQVYSVLSSQEQHLDTVAVRTGLSASTILAALTMLEIKGYITTRPGGWARTI
jgi:DNA processing protein